MTRGASKWCARAKARAATCALFGVGLSSTIAYSVDGHAAGLYFSDRGVRPLARGGAFVAGADDVGAIWYNPAGLADAGSSLMADFSWLHFTSDYTRRTQVADTNGTLRTYESPTVSGSTPILPLPTIGGTYNFGPEKEWTLGLGVFAPYTAIASYPLTVNGQPSPSRYSLVSLDGSALLTGGAWMAWKPIEQVRLGVGLEALVGTFDSTVVFSASPQDRLIGAPEDANYDAFSQLKVGPIFAPSANMGATFVPDKHVRIGISGQLPFSVNAPAKIKVRLPNAPEFDKASQVGEDAHVKFKLPAIVRAGIELRNDMGKSGAFRAELTYVREFWSSHESIDITPDNIKLYGVTGFPSPFGVSPISIPRHFESSNSFRVGGEYAFKVADYVIDARLGFNYETSAIPNAYLSPLTIDLNKYTLGIGGGIHIGAHWRLDAVIAHVFTSEATVDPAEAAVPRVNPVKGNPTQAEAVNGGKYAARADVVGVGVNYKF
jgi:long-chain fatty acid transport protein